MCLSTVKKKYNYITVPFALIASRQIEDWANLIASNYISFNTAVSGRIEDGAEPCAAVEGPKNSEIKSEK